MRYGKVAILITIAAAALRCSGNPPVSEPGQAVLNAPSFTLRGGTREILRGIIARGLGLR